MQGRTRTMIRWGATAALAFGLAGSFPQDASAARLKDIAIIQGVQGSQIYGYGLVIGLSGTGDQTTNVPFARNALANVLKNLGQTVDQNDPRIRLGNVAAVMVTADVPAFKSRGTRIDVLVSAIGDSRSLQGGTLFETVLYNNDGDVIATAQGPISTGGFLVEARGDRVQKNHPTVGRVPNGGQIEEDVSTTVVTTTTAPADPNAPAAQPQTTTVLTLGLQNPDFTTAARTASAINTALNANVATATNPATITVNVSNVNAEGLVQFIANLENLEVSPDQKAKVIIDERTGTVVMGENVRISAIAVGNASLNVVVFETPIISQPMPFSEGSTVVVPDAEITVTEPSQLNDGGAIQILPESLTLNELVQALNALGVGPRDLISILQAIREAGALQAELVIM